MVEEKFSKCGPWAAESSSLRNLLRIQVLGPTPDLLKLWALVPASCDFTIFPGDNHAHQTLKTVVEEHPLRILLHTHF